MNTGNTGNDNDDMSLDFNTQQPTYSSSNDSNTNPSSTSNSRTDVNPNPTSVSLTKTDPSWEFFTHKKDGIMNIYTCLFCSNSYKGGGINRMKYHLAGIPGQIASCKNVPGDVRHRFAEPLKASSK